MNTIKNFLYIEEEIKKDITDIENYISDILEQADISLEISACLKGRPLRMK